MNFIYNQNQVQPQNRKQNKQCRICLQGDRTLIVPCKCDGTVRHVHQQCLKRWGNQILKKNLKKQQQQGQLEQISQIQCQLCKQNIKLSIEWKSVWLSFQKAKQKSGQYFWPLFLVNILISLICLLGVVLMSAVIILVLIQSNQVNYVKYKSQPLYMWGMTVLVIVFAAIFLIKSIKDTHYMFSKLQFQIKNVVLQQKQQMKLKNKPVKEIQNFNQLSKNQLQFANTIDSRKMMIKNNLLQSFEIQSNVSKAKKLRNRHQIGKQRVSQSQSQSTTKQQILFSVRQTQKPCQQQLFVSKPIIL